MPTIALDKESGASISLFLFKELRNVNVLRKKIVSGELQCCAVKPSLIVDPLQIVIASNKAVLHKKFGKLTTKSLNSELLFNLSVSKSISQSLRTFGLGDKDENVLIVVFNEKEEEEKDLVNFKSDIEGIECDLSEIKNFTDSSLIKKIYKITDNELLVSTLANSVISRIATKDFGAC